MLPYFLEALLVFFGGVGEAVAGGGVAVVFSSSGAVCFGLLNWPGPSLAGTTNTNTNTCVYHLCLSQQLQLVIDSPPLSRLCSRTV